MTDTGSTKNSIQMDKADAVETKLDVEMAIGEAAEDGWKYCGISPDTKKPMFAAPHDSGIMNYHGAMERVTVFQEQGKCNVRLPSNRELTQMFNNKAQIGGFMADASNKGEWYLSSTEHNSKDNVIRNLTDGRQYHHGKDFGLSAVRLVRS